jgi:hypothetical protein
MAFGFFKKNVVEKIWEVVYSTGKSKEIYYIRDESEYNAKNLADEHANLICGKIISMNLISDNGEKIPLDLEEGQEQEE